MSTPFDLKVTDALLSTTRAVRKRLDLARPVPREVILDCIRLSQQAPTGSNAQTWRWLIVTDAALKKEIARVYREAGAQYLEMARARVSQEGDAQTKRVYDSAFWLLDHLADVPVHAIPCVIGRPPAAAPIAAHASVYGSIFPAVWTLHLFREAEVAKLLGIPEGVAQVALLPVAYTKGTDFKPAERPAPETITSWNRWSA